MEVHLKKIEIGDKERSSYTQFRLGVISIKEIMDKYPDKVVDVYAEGKNAVIQLDTCRIKFTNTEINRGAENGKSK
jgi:hypothetical protein